MASGVVAVMLLLSGCTGSEEPAATPEESPAASASASQAEPVPTRIEVARVYGSLRRPLRRSLTRKVQPPVDRWFEAAYLGGGYPRRGVGNAFASFTDGAAAQARSDRRLMSNAGLDATVSSVTARRKSVRLDVLAPRGLAAGVTARFRLVFDAVGDRAVRHTVQGRLLLTRTESGWRVFGYDLARATQQLNGQ